MDLQCLLFDFLFSVAIGGGFLMYFNFRLHEINERNDVRFSDLSDEKFKVDKALQKEIDAVREEAEET